MVLSGRYASNAEDWRALSWSIAALLLAQTVLWVGGEAAVPVARKLGFWRGLAVTVFFIQSLTSPLTLVQVVLGGLMTGFQIAWALSGGVSAFVFVLIIWKRWKLRALKPRRA